MSKDNLISPELLESYITYTNECLEKLEGYLHILKTSENEDHQLRKDIFSICHDIKGMGGSFNYPLMTEAGTAICSYLRNLDPKEATQSELVEAHIKTMRAIIENNITGSGGETGEQLIKRLNELVDHSLA